MEKIEQDILQKTDVDKLPSLPNVLLQLLDICHDESMSYEQLTTIFRNDPALYIKALSVYSRSTSNVVTGEQPEQVLQHLGLNTIKNIAVTSAAQQFFSRTSHERTIFLKQHWYDSMMCGVIAESIAKLSGYKYPEEAYLAGLLHDIGQLVLENAYPDKYSPVFAQVSEEDYFHSLELDEFDTTHYQLGAELMSKHGANPFLADAILYHHEPFDKILDAHPLVKITNLANQLSTPYQLEDDSIFRAAERLFGLSKPLILEIIEKARKTVLHIAEELDIELVTDGIDGEAAKKIASKEQYKQVQLAEQVRNIAMLDGIHQHLSRIEGETALVQAIEQHVGILFGVKKSIVFLYSVASNSVRPLATNKLSGHLEELSIPVEPGRSLITETIISKKAVHSFDEQHANLAVIDRQLSRLLSCEGLLCTPMIVNGTTIGAMAFGVDRIQQEVLVKQRSLLARFSNEIAHTISATNRGNRQNKNSSEQENMLEALISEVSHEVRNPLSIMSNYLEILSFKLDSDNPAQSDIKTIKGEIERVGNILTRLSEPAAEMEQVTPVDINTLITDMTNFFKSSVLASRNIEIKLDLDDRIRPLPSNANALKQIYTNLIKNAAEAISTNGQLLVYTQDNVNVDGQEHIEITVSDDGPGIPTELLPQIFSPVDTTKGGEHAGLGLAIVKNLVGELHGSINCRSSNKGTSFHILLPKTKCNKTSTYPVFAQENNNTGGIPSKH